jgi:glycosyltransferase involved in cell wall biosynthesis
MKILWIKTDFLHPTNRGGQIRTLEMIRQLHRRHEIHYVGLDTGEFREGPGRAGEDSSFHYAVPHKVPPRNSTAFLGQVLRGLLSPLPVAVARYQSRALRDKVVQLSAEHHFDAIVCDFLFPAVSLPDLRSATVFQHNVEAMIWRRHAQHGRTPLHRWYFRGQYKRMLVCEGNVCRTAKTVIAVSRADALAFEREYGLVDVPWVPTGVDVDYFEPPVDPPRHADIVFVGSMDWMPNIDAALWFSQEILPAIRAVRPETSVAFAGRTPTAEVSALAKRIPGVQVTGTVPDIRPWLHGALLSIVPIRIGGGTRLKIYEAMAAGCPVVSTTVGAEGLDYTDGGNILIANTPPQVAAACLKLLGDPPARLRLGSDSRNFVSANYSWGSVTSRFEQVLFS